MNSLTIEQNIKSALDNQLLSDRFTNKIAISVQNFIEIQQDNIPVSISFSGGKDSHAVLGVYLLYLKLGYPRIDLQVTFADTRLECKDLIDVVDTMKTYCQIQGIQFNRVSADKSYWWHQFVYGLPVPNWKARWCTKHLKIKPLKTDKRRSITGAHFGESAKRDLSLKQKTCGGESCGTDKLTERYDPIIYWDNDDVWTFLLLTDGILFPKSTFNQLQSVYEVNADTKTGSLRMGCVMCPVVSRKTLTGNHQNKDFLLLRDLLEELRQCRRINNPRTKKAGAIYIKERRRIWQKFHELGAIAMLLDNSWITKSEVQEIDLLIQKDYYPKTYSQTWIESEHKRIEIEMMTEPIQLSLFD